MGEKITVSVIKADVGSVAGHTTVPDEIKAVAEKKLNEAKERGVLIDFRVLNAGDDLELIMTHRKGVDNEEIHGLAWETFEECAKKAKELKLVRYAATIIALLPIAYVSMQNNALAIIASIVEIAGVLISYFVAKLGLKIMKYKPIRV